MSAVYLLIVFALWVGLSRALWKGWRRWRAAEGGNRRARDAAALIIGVLWLGVSFWYAGGQKIYYDMQVNRLCAIDGGIKVYETVRLPAERFDKYGNVRIPAKKDARPGDEYYYEVDYHYYRKGDPQMTRRQAQIIRRSDGKILGESISYSRGGGDLPGPWHGSSFICPPISKDRPGLEVSIFLRGDEK
jgi:hypothetical protein